MESRILPHLEALVGFDTQNPPRNIDSEHAIFDYLKRKLGTSFEFELRDLGDGCLWLLATRGTPKVLFNFHIDTVPAAQAYSADPFVLRLSDGVATGLGACDIKGASACMLAALEEAPEADVALLFSSDEEFGSSRCIKEFCSTTRDYELVIVGEPTNAKAIFEHRGIMTGTVEFSGVSGHASSGRADADSAVHHAVRWSANAMDFATTWKAESYGPLTGIRFNLGRMEGGVKPNMIADQAMIRFGFRPLPGGSNQAIFQEFAQCVTEDADAKFTPGFDAPALPAAGVSVDSARQHAERLGFKFEEPVNFWTEASLFSAAGFDTFVYGPGDIAQAHTADEFVEIASLVEVAKHYVKVLESI